MPVPHYGVALGVQQFQQLAERCRQQGVSFVIEPHLRFQGGWALGWAGLLGGAGLLGWVGRGCWAGGGGAAGRGPKLGSCWGVVLAQPA